MKPTSPIPFIDLQAQRQRIAADVNDAVLHVIESGAYILGPEVHKLESDLAAFAGVDHVVSCASGTDSLYMVLLAMGVKPGDAIFVPAFTFVATAEVVALAGATPVFVDILPDTYNMDPESLKAAITHARQLSLNPVGVIPVDLFGLPADHPTIEAIAKAENLWVMPDAAQGFGSRINGRASVSFGLAGSTSFFPAKPLGCYGDGGAIFTNDEALVDRLKSVRVHGQGTHKYENVRLGINGRLDTIQAAVLNEKLKIYEDEIQRRQTVADRYTHALKEVATTPVVPEGYASVWAQYTLRVPNRDQCIELLKEKGVPTMVYYPIPLHQQKAYKDFPVTPSGLGVSEKAAGEVLSLPMHPYLEAEIQDYIVACVKEVVTR